MPQTVRIINAAPSWRCRCGKRAPPVRRSPRSLARVRYIAISANKKTLLIHIIEEMAVVTSIPCIAQWRYTRTDFSVLPAQILVYFDARCWKRLQKYKLRVMAMLKKLTPECSRLTAVHMAGFESHPHLSDEY